MKTNVTLKLDSDLLREARLLAAEEGRSVSALLTNRLEAMVRERKAFEKARRRALARLRPIPVLSVSRRAVPCASPNQVRATLAPLSPDH
jgi:hypothetical protein